MDDQDDFDGDPVQPGESVYNKKGQFLGQVINFTEDGFEAEMVGTDKSDPEIVPDRSYGEGYLMWRCGECGEMGELEDGLPESCPECGAPREALSEVIED
jgi:rubrerythrin